MRRLLFATLTVGALLLPGCSAEPAAPVSVSAPTQSVPPVFEGPSGLELESEQAARVMREAAAAAEAQRRAEEAAAAEAQRRVEEAAAVEAARRADEAAAAAEAARARAAARAEAEVSPPTADECIGYGCSPEQDAAINEGERLANDDYGPGCDYQLCSEQD